MQRQIWQEINYVEPGKTTASLGSAADGALGAGGALSSGTGVPSR